MNWLSWALLSAFFAALTAVLAKVGVSEVNSHVATAIRTAVVLVLSLVIVWCAAPQGSLRSVLPRSWLFLVLSGLATGLSWLCYFRAIQLGDVSRVASIDKLSVVFVVLTAAVILRERFNLATWLGCSLMATGAVIIVFGTRR